MTYPTRLDKKKIRCRTLREVFGREGTYNRPNCQCHNKPMDRGHTIPQFILLALALKNGCSNNAETISWIADNMRKLPNNGAKWECAIKNNKKSRHEASNVKKLSKMGLLIQESKMARQQQERMVQKLADMELVLTQPMERMSK